MSPFHKLTRFLCLGKSPLKLTHEDENNIIESYILHIISQKNQPPLSNTTNTKNKQAGDHHHEISLLFDEKRESEDESLEEEEEDEYRKRRIQELASTRRPVISYSRYCVALSDIQIAAVWRNIMSPPEKAEEEYEKEGTLLLQAAQRDDIVQVMEIVGSNPCMLWYRDSVGLDTAMHVAARAGSKNTVARLLESINQIMEHRPMHIVSLATPSEVKNKYGFTPLHLALKHRHEDVAYDLVIKGNPRVAYRPNNAGHSPLYLAIKAGYKGLVEEIFHRAPWSSIDKYYWRDKLLQPKNKGSLVHTAIKARDLGMLQIILNNIPALMETSDEKGWQPLACAAHRGYMDETRYLLKNFRHYARKCDENGYFPIHKAVTGGHVDIVKEFVSLCPKAIYDTDSKGRSVLHIAVEYGAADVLSYLVNEPKLRHVFHMKDNNGNTFVDLAKQQMTIK